MIILHDLLKNPVLVNEALITTATMNTRFNNHDDYLYTKVIVKDHYVDVIETPEEILLIINQNK